MSEDIELVRGKLNSVSACFCLAKWTTVTLHLESGTTHSCHHPKPHFIPLDEIKKNSSALHNTKHKIYQRQKMFYGVRPEECQYCWNIEDLKSKQLSDRLLKSATEYSFSDFEKIKSDPFSKQIIPKYVEVSFSNTCQFKCSYCSADYSSTWEAEINKFGPYFNNVGQKTNSKIPEEGNPYIKAFWDWWPELKKGLHTFRITGGEPLLSPNTFQFLQSILESPLPEISLGINSNLGAPQAIIDKFIYYCGELQKNNCVKEFVIFASLDAHGKQAEYIRNGLNHQYFWENVERILESSDSIRVTIMCTFNALSVTSFEKLIDKVDEMNKKHRKDPRIKPVIIDISYLRYPELQTVKILPPEFASYVENMVKKIQLLNIEQLSPEAKYYDLELVKLGRVLEWMREPIIDLKNQNKIRGMFHYFFTEHDKRRGTNFLEIFPEMKEFWTLCEEARSGERWMKNNDEAGLKKPDENKKGIFSSFFNKIQK